MRNNIILKKIQEELDRLFEILWSGKPFFACYNAFIDTEPNDGSKVDVTELERLCGLANCVFFAVTLVKGSRIRFFLVYPKEEYKEHKAYSEYSFALSQSKKTSAPTRRHRYKKDGIYYLDVSDIRMQVVNVGKYTKWAKPFKRNIATSLSSAGLSTEYIESVKAELKGKSLACECELGKKCHADILLEIANT